MPGEDSGLALVSEEIGDAHAELSAEDLCVAFEELRSPTVQSRVHTYTVSHSKEGKKERYLDRERRVRVELEAVLGLGVEHPFLRV